MEGVFFQNFELAEMRERFFTLGVFSGLFGNFAEGRLVLVGLHVPPDFVK
jgi:hypothetical protein